MPNLLIQPESLKETIESLALHEDSRVVGGGTGLMLMHRAGLFDPYRLVTLRRIDDDRLGEIRHHDGSIWIGGQCTLTVVERSATINREFPVLVKALRSLSNRRTRNVATVAGCVAHGDPHMDLPPVLLTLGAEIVIFSGDEEKSIPCDEFFLGYYEVALGPDEIILGLSIPTVETGTIVSFQKFTGNTTEDWPLVGVSLSLQVANDRIAMARIAVGSLEPTVRRIRSVENALRGEVVKDVDIKETGRATAIEVNAIDDLNGSVWFKRRIVATMVSRSLSELLSSRGAP